MIRKNMYMLLTAALFAGIVSCNDSDSEETINQVNGDYVSFSIGQTQSRTERDPDNKYQINWSEGDSVYIWSDCAKPLAYSSTNRYLDAVYAVNRNDTTRNHGKLEYNPDGLLWPDSKYTECKFYAIYPTNAMAYRYHSGISGTINNRGLKYPSHQKAKVKSESGGAYVCDIDMSNAYMAAKATGKRGDVVSLEFNPIMTTLDIKLVNALPDNEDITLTGVTVTFDPSLFLADMSSGNFNYDFDSNSITSKQRFKLDSSSSSYNSTYLNIHTHLIDSDGTPYITLKNGQSVQFTTFLPPVEIGEDNKIKIYVHSMGHAPNVIELGGNEMADGQKLEFAASSLGSVKLNLKSTPATDWLSTLSDDITFSWLSLPGANEAASYLSNGTNQHQNLTIAEQFAQGVRAFVLHVKTGDDENNGYMYIDGESSSTTLDQFLEDEIIPLLKAHPTEFIYLQIKPEGKVTYYLYNIEQKYKDYLVSFQPKETLRNLRGKIMMIHEQDGYSYNSSYYEDYYKNIERAYIAFLYYDLSNTLVPYRNYWYGKKTPHLNTGQIPYLKVDYYYRKSGDKYNTISERIKGIKHYLDYRKRSTRNCDGTDNNLCFCNLMGYDDDADNTAGYQAHAKAVYPSVYEWFGEQTRYIHGIVFMDFVGQHDIDGTPIYGDLLPQLIIDQNFK